MATPLGCSTLSVTTGRTATFEPPLWAYPETPRAFQPDPDDGSAKRLPGSTKSFTSKQLGDLFAPPDWYPAEHPRMPQVVARGRAPKVQACAACHLPNGLGRPESSSLAGLTIDYMTGQLADFKNGSRHSSVGEPTMVDIARALSGEDIGADLG